ncbi:MAG: aminotransferase class V-fold PLP-dependent enzyme [Treponema sp.]|nr:aminotransferase class V-fold PLP-dependent enzyme [Treponema sp.]
MAIYANYAATSPSLSDHTLKELYAYLGGTHLNAGRNFEGIDTGKIALRARRAVADLLGIGDPLRVIFTSGATAALNMAIHGLAGQGDHVLATSIEHNASARPLQALYKNGVIDLEWLQCEPDGSLDPAKVRRAIRENTRLLVMSHASNVLGTILPVTDCFRIARESGVFTVLDMAQTAGVLPWTMGEYCDVAVFAGHKGLGALAGTGGMAVSERACSRMRPWIAGGTGSISDSLDMPDFLPDKFEAGTQNTAGILSLASSVEEILRTGVKNIRDRERSLTARFITGALNIKNVTLYGTLDPDRCTAVVSVIVRGYNAAEASRHLFEKYGIITRSGLHCSPLAHKTAGTFPHGTVRFSFGYRTTDAEIDIILEALSAM